MVQFAAPPCFDRAFSCCAGDIARPLDGEIACPNCGLPLRGSKMLCEEAVVAVPDDDVHWVSRKFTGICPVHGERIGTKGGGNHLTTGPTGRPALKARFLRHSPAILAVPEPAERRRFKLALKGRLSASEADLARWDAAAPPGDT